MFTIFCGDGTVGDDFELWQPVMTDASGLAAYNPATGEYRFGEEAKALLTGAPAPVERRRAG